VFYEKIMPVSQTGSIPAPDRRALILVVERNPIVQRLEKYFLEHAGFAIEFVADGRSALARARELHPKILVTEILVPQMDGLSLCHTLKTDPATSDIRVLVFSHLHAEDRARDAGADAFMVKPLDEARLIKTVEDLISRAAPVSVGEKA
jgi:two-component system response regulator MprA